MSAPESSLPGSLGKRKRVKQVANVANRQGVEREGGLVIVSNFGDTRPEEIVPDTVATYCLNCTMSVRSYVIVPNFATFPIFLANYTREAEKDIVKKRYVKRMFPSTIYLKGITCDVMMLCCHGIPKFKDKDGIHHPHALCFNEGNSVNPFGDRREFAPPTSQVWSCSSYTEEGLTYTKREGGITLSDVVCGSRLVLLLCCCGLPIYQEYCAEMGQKVGPDFVYLEMDHAVHDISINIFLAMLITALEAARDRDGPCDEVFKRCICQVLLWVQENGGDEVNFWEYLITLHCVEMRGNGTLFRIKGCINNYGLEMEDKLNDKQIVLRELQSVTMLLWEADGRQRVVNYRTDGDVLEEWIDGKPFRQASHGAREESPDSVQGLLLQLKGLLSGV
jgi:hypothetical protein